MNANFERTTIFSILSETGEKSITDKVFSRNQIHNLFVLDFSINKSYDAKLIFKKLIRKEIYSGNHQTKMHLFHIMKMKGN